MAAIDFLALYVKNLPISVEFYKDLLGLEPVAQRPGFAQFALPNGLNLGLWLAGTVEPEAEIAGGGAEYGIPLPNAETLRASHDTARNKGISIVQPPTEMNFGLTYVIEDPDRHRLRYIVPARR